MQSKFILKFLTLTFSLIFASSLYAQTNGNISGTVTDTTGAAIPGATVKAVSNENGTERTATSNDEGFYTLQQ